MENCFDFNSGIIFWFVWNLVVVNLLMIFIIVMGIVSFMII